LIEWWNRTATWKQLVLLVAVFFFSILVILSREPAIGPWSVFAVIGALFNVAVVVVAWLVWCWILDLMRWVFRRLGVGYREEEAG
jgi:hypothetical protein